MYTFKKAVAIDKNINSRWKEVDISLLRIVDIFTVYRKIYVTLNNVFLPNSVFIDLDILRIEFSASELSFNDLLILIGNRTLETIPTIPDLTVKNVKFSDAFRAGYKITPQNIFASVTAELPPSEKTSLRIERHIPETNMKTFYDNCLVTINGFFHRTDYDGTYAYALNANESLFKSKQNQIGFLSFLDIGKIEQVAIIPSMISKQDANSPLKDKTYIKLNRDITNKTVILVLGGYLLFTDGTSFWQTGDDTFAINFKAMPLLERYFESNPYINLKSLGLPASSDNISLINVHQFFTDEVLIKYMTLSQSFFIIVDTKSLFTNKIYLRPSALPGMFTAYKEPTLPLFVNYGRVAEYWKTHEDGHWAVNVQDSYLRNSVFSSKPEDQLVNISDSVLPLRTYYNSRGFLLEIGHDGL